MQNKPSLVNVQIGLIGRLRTQNRGYCFAVPFLFRGISEKETASRAVLNLNQGNNKILNMDHFKAIAENWATRAITKEELTSLKGKSEEEIRIYNLGVKPLINLTHFLGLLDKCSARKITTAVIDTLRKFAQAKDKEGFQSFAEDVLKPMLAKVKHASLTYVMKNPSQAFDRIETLTRIPPDLIDRLEGLGDYEGFASKMETSYSKLLGIAEGLDKEHPPELDEAEELLNSFLMGAKAPPVSTERKSPPSEPAKATEPKTRPSVQTQEIPEDDAWGRTTAVPLRSFTSVPEESASASEIELPPMSFELLAEVKLPLHDVPAMSEAEHEQYAYEESLRVAASGLMELI